MKTTWLVQSNLLDPVQINKILDVLKENNIPHYECKVTVLEDIQCSWEEESQHNKIIPYGSSKLTSLALEKGWKGLFYDPLKHRVDAWNTHRDDMLNHDAEILTVGELKEHFNGISDNEMYFIRPCEGRKVFNGSLTNAKELRRWRDSDDSQNFAFRDHILCAISSPKEVQTEWRWFIVNRKIISGSIYKMYGQRFLQREDDVKVIAEAQDFADKWLPYVNCVMDIGLTKDGSKKIIEFNCFNSSGFYDHDISSVVQSATDYVENL